MFLDYRRFETIKRTVSEVYEDFCDSDMSFPLDVFALARKMGIKMASAQKLERDGEKRESIAALPSATMADGNGKIGIFINDLNESKARSRFDGGHEIGHVVLAHKEDYRRKETEADFFAHELIIPTCLLVLIPDEIINDERMLKVFGVCGETYAIALRYRRNRIQAACGLILKDYEISMIKNLWPAFMKAMRKAFGDGVSVSIKFPIDGYIPEWREG